MRTFKHDDWLYKQLQNAEFVAEFLTAAKEDDDPETYLSALKQLAVARGTYSLENAHKPTAPD